MSKIPLLWKLLLDLRQAQSEMAKSAMIQLLLLMDDSYALRYLNECILNPPSNLEPMPKRVDRIYPFLQQGASLSHFVRLLVWTAEIPEDELFPALCKAELQTKYETYPDRTVRFFGNKRYWFYFLHTVVRIKTGQEMEEWQNLLKDRYRWTPPVVGIETTLLGYLLWGIPILLGVPITILCILGLVDIANPSDKLLAALTLICFGGFSGVVLDGLWYIWCRLLERGEILGIAGAFPEFLSDRAWSTKFSPNIVQIISNLLIFNLACFLTNPHINSLTDNLIIIFRQSDTEESWNILYIWLALIFISHFLPALKWFDRGHVIYLRKPNRYLHLYDIPGVERWLPPEK